jgi:hypothetical protein
MQSLPRWIFSVAWIGWIAFSTSSTQAIKIPSSSECVAGWRAAPSLAPTLSPDTDSPLDQANKGASAQLEKESKISGKKTKKRKRSKSMKGEGEKDPSIRSKSRKNAIHRNRDRTGADPAFGLGKNDHSSIGDGYRKGSKAKPTAFVRDAVPPTKLARSSIPNNSSKRMKHVKRINQEPSNSQSYHHPKMKSSKQRKETGRGNSHHSHPTPSRPRTEPQRLQRRPQARISRHSDESWNNKERNGSQAKRKKAKRKGIRPATIQQAHIQPSAKTVKKRRKSKKQTADKTTVHSVGGSVESNIVDATDSMTTRDLKLDDEGECSSESSESNVQKVVPNLTSDGDTEDLSLIDQAGKGPSESFIDNKNTTFNETVVPESKNLSTSQPFDKEPIPESQDVVVESTVFQAEDSANMRDVDDQNELPEAVESSLVADFDTKELDTANNDPSVQIAISEAEPGSFDRVNDSDKSARGELEDDLALSAEERRNEEEADQMDRYAPTLLEGLPVESTTNNTTTPPPMNDLSPFRSSKTLSENGFGSNSTYGKDTVEPDQDVVNFIGDVLEEDVKSWITDADSFSEILGNKTRGGHSTTEETSHEKDSQAASLSSEEGTDNTGEPTSELVEEVASPSKVASSCLLEQEDSQHPPTQALDRASLEGEEDRDTDISVSVVTWNLAEESPSEEEASFLRSFRKNGVRAGTGSDLVLISGQECENIKPRRSEGRRSREFRRLMVMMLGKGYVPIGLHLLGGIQFGLFAKRSFLKEIEDVTIADVTCGIGNVFHNKGAIAAFLTVKARNDSLESPMRRRSKYLRMVFVTAHMAAHVKNADARDADFWRISSELQSAAPEGFVPARSENPDNGSSFFDLVDRVFFCGDLNYRLDLPRELTEFSVVHCNNAEGSPSELFRYDQLVRSSTEGRAFPGFVEGKISFAPTFKFDKETSMYDTSHKQRIPAWTDRILFRPSSEIRVTEYSSVPLAQHSDHRPVFGAFRVNMQGKELPSMEKKKQRRKKGTPKSKTGKSRP